MRVLAIGDIVGDSGVKKVLQVIKNIKQEKNIDFIIVNAENAADGFGITKKIYDNLINSGVDIITMGDHTWGKKEIFSILEDGNILRPANYPEGVVGHGYKILNCKNKKIAVINLIGRTFMNTNVDNPFKISKEIIQKIKDEADYIFIDFHAEATAEKITLAHSLDGKVTAIFGTHTHVQTADEQILSKGTAYITDIGMNGPKNSSIGMDINVALKRFETGLPEKYKLADGKCIFNSVIFEINDETNQIKSIERYNEN